VRACVRAYDSERLETKSESAENLLAMLYKS
jgi:hypothetical protein